ncbi:MAG TPA: fluoride efflux transporter CrcB [Clostridia bacterium]|nr:fluoride efflux transporter CrcB [Clostridia bacterium]
MELLYIGFGGALGSIARYRLGKLLTEKMNKTFPAGTFLTNISGALLLGLVVSLRPPAGIMLFAAEGFLGAYTTFSTFMYEGFNLFQENEKLNAFIYILGSLFLGIVGYVSGFGIGKLI